MHLLPCARRLQPAPHPYLSTTIKQTKSQFIWLHVSLPLGFRGQPPKKKTHEKSFFFYLLITEISVLLSQNDRISTPLSSEKKFCSAEGGPRAVRSSQGVELRANRHLVSCCCLLAAQLLLLLLPPPPGSVLAISAIIACCCSVGRNTIERNHTPAISADLLRLSCSRHIGPRSLHVAQQTPAVFDAATMRPASGPL
jgi:hypothetical protein